MTLSPSPSVVSAIETDVLDGGESGDECQAIRDAWDGRRLTVREPEALRWSLIELSNTFDDIADGRARGLPDDEIRFARRAVRGMETLLDRLRGSRHERPTVVA